MPDPLTPADRLRAEADAADLLTVLVRCASTRRQDKEAEIATVYGFKESRHEPMLHARCTLTQAAGLPLVAPRDHQVLRLREAPLAPDGAPVPLLLDGERVSVLVRLAEMGRAIAGRSDGDELAVLAFKPCAAEDDEPALKASLAVRFEGPWLLERFTLGQVYRLALLPAPDWLAAAEEGLSPGQLGIPAVAGRVALVRLVDGDMEGSLIGSVPAEAAIAHEALGQLATRTEEDEGGTLTYWVPERERRAAREAISGAMVEAGALLKGVSRDA